MAWRAPPPASSELMLRWLPVHHCIAPSSWTPLEMTVQRIQTSGIDREEEAGPHHHTGDDVLDGASPVRVVHLPQRVAALAATREASRTIGAPSSASRRSSVIALIR